MQESAVDCYGRRTNSSNCCAVNRQGNSPAKSFVFENLLSNMSGGVYGGGNIMNMISILLFILSYPVLFVINGNVFV